MEMGEIDVIAGIGCRTGVAAWDIIAAVDGALAAHALDRSRLRALAVVPLKSREPAIREAALALGVAVDLPSTDALDETDRRTVTSAYGGDWTMRIFTDQTEGTEHVVLTKGDITTPEPVLVRTHSLSVLEDVLALGPAPEGELAHAMRIIAEKGRGAVCLFRDPRAKLIVTEDEGPRTIKQTGLGAQILSSMGLKQLILLTDSPMTRYLGLDAYDLHITGTRPISGD